jgi:hypothetical protein
VKNKEWARRGRRGFFLFIFFSGLLFNSNGLFYRLEKLQFSWNFEYKQYYLILKHFSTSNTMPSGHYETFYNQVGLSDQISERTDALDNGQTIIPPNPVPSSKQRKIRIFFTLYLSLSLTHTDSRSSQHWKKGKIFRRSTLQTRTHTQTRKTRAQQRTTRVPFSAGRRIDGFSLNNRRSKLFFHTNSAILFGQNNRCTTLLGHHWPNLVGTMGSNLAPFP